MESLPFEGGLRGWQPPLLISSEFQVVFHVYKGIKSEAVCVDISAVDDSTPGLCSEIQSFQSPDRSEANTGKVGMLCIFFSKQTSRTTD